MKAKKNKVRNEIRLIDIDDKLFSRVKESAKVNKRSMGKDVEFFIIKYKIYS